MKKYSLKKYKTKTIMGKSIIEHCIWQKYSKDCEFLFLKTVGKTMPKTLIQLKKIVVFLNNYE